MRDDRERLLDIQEAIGSNASKGGLPIRVT
jgi:hypothetical protein